MLQVLCCAPIWCKASSCCGEIEEPQLGRGTLRCQEPITVMGSLRRSPLPEGVGWRKPPYCGFGVELFIVEIGNDIGLRRFSVEGVADDCCDDGCFGLALDFCLFADSFEDSAMIPELWGALLIREHCPAQSLDLLTSRACFFFFPIGIRWATCCNNRLTIFELNVWKQRVSRVSKANFEHR